MRPARPHAAAALVAFVLALPAHADISEADRQALQALERTIAGRETERSAAVFRNVEVLADVPAGRLLRIMEKGYARALGVSCDHCHDTADWAAEAKPPKRIARRMSLLAKELNATLATVPDLADRKPIVNCTTCHRGQKKPALDLDEPPAAKP